MAESLFSRSYSLAMDIDDKFRANLGVALKQEEFDNITNVLQYPSTIVEQLKFYNTLNNLSLENLKLKARQVSILINTLSYLQKNKNA